MGCYNCGSEEGTSTKLCPKCIAAKNSSMEAKMAELTNRRQPSVSASKLVVTIAVTMLAIALVICSGFYFLFSESGPGILLPKYVTVQKLCKKLVEKETSGVNAEASKETTKAPENSDWGGSGVNDTSSVAQASSSCDMDIDECKKEPSKCDGIIARLEKALKNEG